MTAYCRASDRGLLLPWFAGMFGARVIIGCAIDILAHDRRDDGALTLGKSAFAG